MEMGILWMSSLQPLEGDQAAPPVAATDPEAAATGVDRLADCPCH